MYRPPTVILVAVSSPGHFFTCEMLGNSTRKRTRNKIISRLNKLLDYSACPLLVQQNNSGLIQVRHIRGTQGPNGRCTVFFRPMFTRNPGPDKDLARVIILTQTTKPLYPILTKFILSIRPRRY